MRSSSLDWSALCAINSSASTVHYYHCFHLQDSLLGWIMRSSPLDWSALCTTNSLSIEMATVVDLKTWEKLDFTLEMAARLGEDVYCGFLSNFAFR